MDTLSYLAILVYFLVLMMNNRHDVDIDSAAIQSGSRPFSGLPGSGEKTITVRYHCGGWS
jgi:hypothetical protein